MPSDVAEFVEHFFRKEYGRLVALLTKSLGVRQLDLIDDVVQSALSKGLQSWARTGVPADPAGWLFRTARNLAIDAFRRQKVEARVLKTAGESQRVETEPEVDSEIVFETEIGDESLRLLFLCCHPSILLESGVALALKVVGGFSIEEVANSLLISKSNAEKRLTRAKEDLRERGTEIIELNAASILERADSVLSTIYLMFTEGYSATVGEEPIRSQLCNEAIRLARMLNSNAWSSSPSTAALLGLMLLQASRQDARVDADGCIVLMTDQDRSVWNWDLIREAMEWMLTAASGPELSRYHIEAAIAWEHARAECMDTVDWSRVVSFYQTLLKMHPGPMVRLNLIIAQSRMFDAEFGLKALEGVSDEDRKRLRPWWDCAIADVYERLGRHDEAISHLTDALALSANGAQRRLIEQKLIRLRSKL